MHRINRRHFTRIKIYGYTKERVTEIESACNEAGKHNITNCLRLKSELCRLLQHFKIQD